MRAPDDLRITRMAKNYFPLVCLWLLTCTLQAQLFTYSPVAMQYVELPMDMTTEFYTYITNATEDTLRIEWRKIEDTLPEAGDPGSGWFTEMCDFGSCWDHLPNNAVMIPPIPPGGAGFIKLLINPQNLPGAGAVHYWVYPEDQMELHEDVWFYVWTPGLSVQPTEQASVRIYPNPAADHLVIESSEPGLYHLYDASARLVQSFNAAGPARFVYPVQHLSPGCYFLHTPSAQKISLLIE